jgi:catechol 2,3-dioxygenase-like lactoylglutathione lyase family enzyme
VASGIARGVRARLPGNGRPGAHGARVRLRGADYPPVCNDHRVEQRISLITLGVSNLARARAFYEALGWSGAQQPDDEVCFFQAGGMVFGLWTALGGHGAPGIELAYNVRSPDEVTQLLNEAERAGGSIVRRAALAEWGGTTGAFADPEGYVWEVAHNPGWTLDDDGTVHI